ncbi:MAG: rhodanese-like domain-containing protein [Gammaproteobacteria bacterium]|nr:rhodanese-like domain-containing protein [Gammaproteobacteria bacterium]
MEAPDPISITDPEGIAILLAVIFLYLGVRLIPHLVAGFGAFVPPYAVNKRRLEGELLIDVRSPTEFDGDLGHIPSSINIPLDELRSHLEGQGFIYDYRLRTVVIVCRTGSRAAFAVRMLRRSGFLKPLVLSGGILSWVDEGLPIEYGRSAP